MIERKAIVTIVIVLAMISVFAYTWNSSSSEPHPPNPVITSSAYSHEIAKMNNGSSSTQFFHTFSLAGSNATFGFSLYSTNPTVYVVKTWGGVNGQVISMTKVHQTMGFPYIGTFMLQIASINVTIKFNGSSYYSTVKTQGPYYMLPDAGSSNASVVEFYYGYGSPINFTVNSSFNDPTVLDIIHIKSYNVAYSLEVTPIVEIGPYYITGKTQWISHTFEYPFPTSS